VSWRRRGAKWLITPSSRICSLGKKEICGDVVKLGKWFEEDQRFKLGIWGRRAEGIRPKRLPRP